MRPEKREKGPDPWSNRHRGRRTSLLFSKVLSCYKGANWKETINIQEFLHIRGHKKAFFALWCSCKPKPCLYLQSYYIAATLNLVYVPNVFIYCSVRFGSSPVVPTSWARHWRKGKEFGSEDMGKFNGWWLCNLEFKEIKLLRIHLSSTDAFEYIRRGV